MYCLSLSLYTYDEVQLYIFLLKIIKFNINIKYFIFILYYIKGSWPHHPAAKVDVWQMHV